MKRVGIVVAYDGTNYSGWQIQPNGVTIQGVLNETLSRLLGEEIEVMGASRTDAGVHALGNVAVFDTNARMPAGKISFALNQFLPEDIRNIFDVRRPNTRVLVRVHHGTVTACAKYFLQHATLEFTA